MSPRARTALLMAGIVALFIAAGLLAHSRAAFDAVRDHSSERRNPWGTAAWRELIEACGVPAATWDRPLTELSPDQEFVVILAPTDELTRERWDALVAWVRGGGRAVVGPSSFGPLGPTGRWDPDSLDARLRDLGIDGLPGPSFGGEVSTQAADALTADVDEVLVPGEYRLVVSAEERPAGVGEPVVLLADGAGAGAIALPIGEGMLIALAEAEIFANATIGEADNVVFAANLVFAGGPPAAVHFDEFQHGVREEIFSGPRVDPQPFQQTGLALLGVAVIFAIGRGRRFGAPQPPAGPARRGAADHVRAFAGLYERAGAAGAAAAMLAAGLRRRVARAAGVPASAPPEAVLAALNARGLAATGVADLLSRLDDAGSGIGGRELLALAREVARYERMLGP